MNTALSAVIITHNAADQLADCLNSLSFVSEIIILDSGSDDATKDIARLFNARFIEQQWPNTALRTLCWNTALGLAAVYWLNGLSVLAYALGGVRAHPLMTVGAVLTFFYLLYCDPVLVVSLVGLFDTWGDFRRKIDAIVTARRLREQSDEDDL